MRVRPAIDQLTVASIGPRWISQRTRHRYVSVQQDSGGNSVGQFSRLVALKIIRLIACLTEILAGPILDLES